MITILLIFDEGYGAWPMCAYTAEAFGATPDILNLAKQITNGAVPMGAVMATPEIYETFMAHGGLTMRWSLPTVTRTGAPRSLCGRLGHAGSVGQG